MKTLVGIYSLLHTANRLFAYFMYKQNKQSRQGYKTRPQNKPFITYRWYDMKLKQRCFESKQKHFFFLFSQQSFMFLNDYYARYVF